MFYILKENEKTTKLPQEVSRRILVLLNQDKDQDLSQEPKSSIALKKILTLNQIIIIFKN